jgi:hypothetical protein
MTVPPANSTARPDVFSARMQAASGSRPADDEQRVVDPDAEADERGEDGRERRDVDRVGEQTGEAQAAPEREHRGDQRQQRRPQRAERDREHDRRREEADELARTAALRLAGLLDPATAELHLQAVAARGLSGVDQLVVGGLRDVGDRLLAVHVHVGERDRAVFGDLARGRALSERAVDALDMRPLGDRVERLLDPRLDRRIVDVVGGEHHLVGVGRLGVEVVRQQVQRGRGLRPRQRERVRVARSGTGAEAAEDHQRHDPDGEHDELAAEAPTSERSHRPDRLRGDHTRRRLAIFISARPSSARTGRASS